MEEDEGRFLTGKGIEGMYMRKVARAPAPRYIPRKRTRSAALAPFTEDLEKDGESTSTGQAQQSAY